MIKLALAIALTLASTTATAVEVPAPTEYPGAVCYTSASCAPGYVCMTDGSPPGRCVKVSYE